MLSKLTNLVLAGLALALPAQADTTPPKYGFYSAKAAAQFGYATYTDVNGNDVYITLVSDTNPPKNYQWDDVKMVGEVITFKRSFISQTPHHISSLTPGLTLSFGDQK